MSTEATTTPATTSATVTTTAPATPAPAPSGGGDGEIKLTSKQLNERLERAQEKALKDLGLDPADAKAKLEAWKKRDADDLSETEKRRLADVQHAETKKQLDSYSSEFKAIAKAQMAELTDEQRKAVEDIAGDDAAARIKAIRALSPTWRAKAEAAGATTTTAPAAAPPAGPPVQTAPITPAPAPASTSPTDHKAVWESLKKSGNKADAADYLLEHAADIYKG